MHTPTMSGLEEPAGASDRPATAPGGPAWTPGRLASIAVQVVLGAFTVIDFAEDRTVGALAAIASCLALALALVLLTSVLRSNRAGRGQGLLATLSVLLLLMGAGGVTAALMTNVLGYRTSVVGYSADGVVIDRAAELPRCNATVTGEARDGDATVWVAHREAGMERWFYTRAERTETDPSRWTANLVLGADPGPGGAATDGPQYEIVALSAGEASDSFLATRGYAGTEDSITGLVYFGDLPPGVSQGENSMTVTRLAGAGGVCPPR